MKVLMVLTSHRQLGDGLERTGIWLEGFAAPYYIFKEAHAAVILASPAGHKVPIDPRSEQPDNQAKAMQQLLADSAALELLTKTRKLSDIDPEGFDALFYPDGYGSLWDLAEDHASRLLINAMYAQSKPVAAVGHGLAAFRYARGPFGLSLVRGKAVTGFSNSEETSAGLDNTVPFLVEDMLKEHGGEYSKATDGQPHVVTTETLVTGQNPASSADTARAVLKMLASRPEARP